MNTNNVTLTMLENIAPIIMRNVEELYNNIDDFIKINNYDDDKIYNFINKIDIIQKLKNIYNYIIKAQSINSFVKNEVDGILEVIKKIEEQINIINERLLYNKSIWLLSSFRKFKFNNRINELNVQTTILYKRLNTLNNYTTINNIVSYSSRTIIGDPID